MSEIILAENSNAPNTPNTGYGKIYPKSDGHWYAKDDTGAERSLSNPDGSVTAAMLADGAALSEILDDDGAGSGLDADLLDGSHASAFAAAGHTHEVDQRADMFSDAEGDPASIGTASDGASTYAARRDHVHAGAASAISNIPAGDIAATTVQAAINELDSEKASRVNSFRQQLVATLYGTISAALTWSAAQAFNAAVTIAANLAGTLATLNQSGAGDILKLQDGGVDVIRFPDGGGIVLVAQAGGFQGIAGLLGYDNSAAGFRRLKFKHEDHDSMVPIDPRNGFRNVQLHTIYP